MPAAKGIREDNWIKSKLKLMKWRPRGDSGFDARAERWILPSTSTSSTTYSLERKVVAFYMA